MNPFKILNVGPDAAAREILLAAAQAMRERRHSAREIAAARQMLMEPEQRAVLAFLHFTDTAPLLRPSDEL